MGIWMAVATTALTTTLLIGAPVTLWLRRFQQRQQHQEAWLLLFQRLVDQRPDSIIITRRDGTIAYVNDAFVERSGYLREEVIDQRPSLLQSGLTPAETYHSLWRTLQAGGQWQGEFINQRRDGTRYSEYSSISPLRDSRGEVTHYVAINHDLRGNVQLQEELDRLQHHLQDKFEERTAELAVAKEQAESANRAKSVFIANMSHEIRTPLNAIIGLTDLLLRGSSDPDQRHKLDRIGNASNHLLALLNDIIDLSKIESGKLTLELVDFDLDELLRDAAALMLERIRARQLDLVLEVAPELYGIVLRGDVTRLSQMLLNYLGNAVKFTHNGSILLRVELLNEPLGGEIALRFIVRDTGIGIEPEKLKRLFLPFEQADNSTTRRYGGSGLGLAINRRLAALFGGEVGASSEAGQGSEFWFSVRLQRRNRPVKSPLPLPRRRALLADVNPMTRQAVSAMLVGLGCDVNVVESSDTLQQALASSNQSANYDLVLLDRQLLPTINLDQTIAQLNSDTTLLLCGYPEPGLQEQALRGGFRALLPKPLTPGLMQRICSALSCNELPLDDGVVPPPRSITEQQLLQLSESVRILLVEDNVINQEVALALLHVVGLAVDVASNGEEALRRLQLHNYHLILMDVQMPIMDGIAATRAIRSQPKYANLPILAMTADTFAEDRQRCLEVGMDDFIGKPVRAELLYDRLLHWLAAEATTEPSPDLADGGTPREVLTTTPLPATVSSEPAALEPEAAIPLLQQLIALLAAHDMAANQLLRHETEGLSRLLGSSVVWELEQRLARFDYPAARQLLQGHLERMTAAAPPAVTDC